jgi:RHS repeat-associated protein
VAKGASSLLTLGYDYTKTGASGCNGTATCNNGNVMGQTITPPGSWSASQSYTYDAENRLSTAVEAGTDGWSENFGYDRWGNQWVTNPCPLNINPCPVTPTSGAWFDTDNRIEDPGNVAKFDYDTRGNQTVKDGSLLGYDGENRQTSYTVASLSKELYSYDGEGRRVQHVHQVYSGGSYNTTATTVYVYDARGRLAAEYGAQSSNASCGTCYLTTDALGSTRLMTDSSGAVVARYDYLPFGQEIFASGSTGRASVLCGSVSCYPTGGESAYAVNQKFTGKERDAETGLDFFRRRYYSSAEARFTSPDPLPILKQKLLDPQQWNMYAYVRNSPLRLTDPTGMYAMDCGSLGDKDCAKRTQAIDNYVAKLAGSKNAQDRAIASTLGTSKDTKNGVTIGFVREFRDANGKVLRDQQGSTGGLFAPGQSTPEGKPVAAVRIDLKDSLTGDALGAKVTHEGEHAVERMEFINSCSLTGCWQGLNVTGRQTEQNAYGSEFRFWRSIGEGDRHQDINSPEQINRFLDQHSDVYPKSYLDNLVFPSDL